ncbi:MAG: class I tRNA ligase family protein, partial [Oscillospiraceae bacterium]|nr:class I tRNA ligase family protein [Oscillospiraceae bacterium]
GAVSTKEPYAKRTSHGMILGEGGIKMSKSRGNVINPNDVIAEFGADTMRTYIMFIGDFEKAAAWSENGVKGCKRFLDRVWNLALEQEHVGDDYSEANVAAIHKAIKKVSDDINAMKFNTAIATLMALVNDFYANGATRGDMKALLTMLSPFAPHMCEELWEMMSFGGEVCSQSWPEYDESKTISATVEMAVQIQGKLRGTIVVALDSDQDTVLEAAKANERVAKSLEGMQIVKVILVKNKLVNLIVKPL